jgi:dephospho-CoA kinase
VVKPLRIGLTGSIGMGKSQTAEFFAELGVPVHDSDAAVHALYEKGGAAVTPVAAQFPDCVRGGAVDRPALAQKVMGDAAALAKLEAIVHPLARVMEREFLTQAQAQGAKLAVLEIPLLFETGAETRLDVVVVVSAPLEIQRQRVLTRPGMSEERLAAILKRQMPDAEKRARADYVVDTSRSLVHARQQVRQIVEELQTRS